MSEVEEKKQGLIDWLINHSKKIIIIMVVFALLISGGLVGIALFNKKTTDLNVVAEVAGEKVYLKEYKERLFAASGGLGTPTQPFISDATKSIKASVLNDLVNLKIVEKELAKNNITISNDELVKGTEAVFKDYKDRDKSSQKAYRDYVRLSIGKDKLKTKVMSWKEGFVLYCYFDRADRDDMVNKPEVATRRAGDQVYAKDYCTKAKERLESNNSNFNEELAKLKADPKIGEAAWSPYHMGFGDSLSKNKDDNKVSKVATPASGNAPSVSVSENSVIVSGGNFVGAYDVSSIMSLGNEKNKYYLLTLKEKVTKKDQDGAFAVVYIKDGNKGETNDFDKWLQDKRGEYQVKTFIERINI